MKKSSADKLDALWIFALGLVVFFGRWNTPGLQPDAAFYAGLSAKVLRTGEAWRLTGSDVFFPIFSDHPPFFFQWGAQVLSVLGHSDGAARAIGGIPGVLSFFLMATWTWRRFGRRSALIASFMMATFGHFTKYAATSMLEAPLSLGVLMTAIGAYEWAWGRPRVGALLLFVGTFLASAAKGLAGFGAPMGLALYWAWTALQNPESRLRRQPIASLVLLMAVGWTSALPWLLWIQKMMSLNALEWIANYAVFQLGGSALTNRGDLSHERGGSVFFYGWILLKNGWPWVWCVPAAWIFAFKNSQRWPALARRWNACALAFSLAFCLPFSFVQFQLAHYIHPIYLPWAPIAALWMGEVCWPYLKSKAGRGLDLIGSARLRWVALAATAIVVTKLPVADNRGQDFLNVVGAVEAIDENCPIVVSRESMDPYRLEAYSLWYWKGHPTMLVDDEAWRKARDEAVTSATERRAFWDFSNEMIVVGRGCRRNAE